MTSNLVSNIQSTTNSIEYFQTTKLYTQNAEKRIEFSRVKSRLRLPSLNPWNKSNYANNDPVGPTPSPPGSRRCLNQLYRCRRKIFRYWFGHQLVEQIQLPASNSPQTDLHREAHKLGWGWILNLNILQPPGGRAEFILTWHARSRTPEPVD